MNPDLPTDEVRRPLGDAELPGVPRRALLSGGLVLGAGLVLAACGSGSDEQIPVTGSNPPAPDSSTTTEPGSAETDVVLLKTAQSIEVLIVDELGKALDSDLLEDREATEALELFRTQHEGFVDLLGTTLRDLGESPVTEPNAYLYENEVAPLMEDMASQDAVLELVLALENTGTATYVKSTPVLTTPELRQVAMSIGAVEARHVALLHLMLDQTPVPTPFFRTAAAAPEQAYVE